MDVPPPSPESNSQIPQQHLTVENQPVGTWSRPKSVAAACERCRRRKIRCDGDTPCATCRRFSIDCIRHRKGAAHVVLEGRIQELEAQVATLSAILSRSQNGSVVENLLLMPPLPTHPSPTDSMSSTFGYPAVGPDVHHGAVPPLDIPRIQIVECANMNAMPMTMSPSGVPVASRSSTMSAIMDTRLMPTQLGINLSPPLSASSSPTWEAQSALSPGSFAMPSPSRRSSASSLALDTNFDLPDCFSSEAGDSLLQVQGFGVSAFGDELEHFNLTTRAEADGLLNFICDRAPGLGVPLSRESLQASLNIVYDHETLTPTNPCSVSMARFQVYMAMAAALRLRSDVRGEENPMLGNCYRLALEQIQSSQFWTQPLAYGAAMLIVLFARATQESSGLG
ncbi:hypothetical protein BDW42DRAFT_109190 [Aspergillus taichungensis]|uniref:Zn(2)-C6 fungal-type domain-containing protein n=1 Tax=Aspergillus taichungensis TaxID=482145 RepID=A0A2J5I8C7_9EURO|nr:hypothetical protein BDW42DRAFT_109190 [Aspergillus taichungensis]